MTNRYKHHRVYYRLKFIDVGALYPSFDTLVYIGENLSEEDTEPTWYFQFADSVASFGAIDETSGGDRRVCLVKASEKDVPLSPDELAEELRKAALRVERNLANQNKNKTKKG
jgi:hypothetical protein